VIVIVHDHPGQHLPARLLAGLRQGGQQHLTVPIIMHDVLPPVPARRDVVKRFWSLNAKLSRHDRDATLQAPPVKNRPLTLSCFMSPDTVSTLNKRLATVRSW
jgi:hypothetical protein